MLPGLLEGVPPAGADGHGAGQHQQQVAVDLQGHGADEAAGVLPGPPVEDEPVERGHALEGAAGVPSDLGQPARIRSDAARGPQADGGTGTGHVAQQGEELPSAPGRLLGGQAEHLLQFLAGGTVRPGGQEAEQRPDADGREDRAVAPGAADFGRPALRERVDDPCRVRRSLQGRPLSAEPIDQPMLGAHGAGR